MPVDHLNGIDINYEVHGEGPPLVLAHGYTASLDMWREQVAALSAHHRLVIYDMRGHGKTTAPSDMAAYRLEREYVDDQIALMDHLHIDRAYVGGLSMGGMLAQEFACQHPERISALLLFDTGPGSPAATDPAIAARFDQMRNMLSGLARSKGMTAVIDMMRANMPGATSAGGAAPPDAVNRYLTNMAAMSVDGYLGGAKALQEWRGTLDRLPSIAVPTLVLVGENDSLLAPSRAIHAKIAGSRFVLLRNAGHGTNMWRPHAFERATLDFLADVAAARPVAGEFTL
jgi:pimeloyl-ACP methyl ester carboxylesterase